MWFLSVLKTVLVAALVTKSWTLDISGADDVDVRLGADASARPPAYLSVPHFKDCLGRQSVNGASFWCKLDEKPEKCPLDSWKQLHEAGPGEENAFQGRNCVD